MTSLFIMISFGEAASKLIEYFKYPFVRNALIVSVLVSLCAALLGFFLVLKRYSALGDGLSHVAFGAATVAATLGIFDAWFTLPVTVIAAIMILRTKADKRVMGDAAIAMLSVGALAIGYTVMSLGGGETNLGGDVCTALFGSSAILSIDNAELIAVSIVTLILVALIAVFYYKLMSITFDESFSAAGGMKTAAYNTATALVCAVVIVVGMKLAGALLISALTVFPALCGMRLCKSFGRALIASGLIGVICAALGVVLSILLETPVGATIAGVDIAFYGITLLIKRK